MDFTFNEEQQMLRDTVRSFVDAEVRPLAAQIDKEKKIPQSLLDQIVELGFLGVPFSEEYGGGGFGEMGLCIFMEEITRGCFSTAVACGGHTSIGAQAIALAGSKEQKQRYMPDLNAGKKWSAYALTEANAGSDAGAMEMTAIPDGDDWILTGSKIWITNGGFADVIVVFAANDRSKGVRGGITAFIVDADSQGFSRGKDEEKMGQCGSSTAEIILDNVRVPDHNRLGAVGDGFKVAMETLDRGRLTLGANCVGAAKEALDISIQYSKDRIAFDKPIAAQQAIQWMLADSAAEIFAMESMLYRTAWMCDEGMPISRESAMVKLVCSDYLDRIVDRAVQIHGGYGYSKEYAVERMYRDSRVNRIFEGTNEIQRVVIAWDLI
ncbi:MAG: acyl-CoA dehydrogenase family protein [Planctomycetota bacterium]|jgi:alkylation response protein AidB-like acyl-CoA dehydrogenase